MIKRILYVLVAVCCFGQLSAQSVKFAVLTDIHQDLMCDCEQRLKVFLDAAKKEKVDFIIDLGDFVFPKESNTEFINLWKNCPIEKYNVIGNHDAEMCTKQEFMDYVGMKSRYYSFDKGGIHFVVLDANHLYKDGKYIPYKNGNFFVDASMREFIDQEQIDWLREDLRKTNNRCLIFCHQSLEMCVGNREAVRAVLEQENERVGYTKVFASLNGHHHTNYEKEINGIVYVQMNSASNQWLGDKYTCTTRFPESEYKRRPALKYLLPWKDCLYGIVTINKKGMKIKGVKSEFIPPVPENMDEISKEMGIPVVPYIKNFKLKFKD